MRRWPRRFFTTAFRGLANSSAISVNIPFPFAKRGDPFNMMIPCIDLQSGRAVQLVHRRERRLAVDDVLGLLERFGAHPLIHVIDLDAAMRKGTNASLVPHLSPPPPTPKIQVPISQQT